MKVYASAGWLCLILSLSCQSALTENSSEAVLAGMRSNLDLPTAPDSLGIYALADCVGPNSEFTTLLISDVGNTRFEQMSKVSHLIGFHSADTSYFYDVLTSELSPVDSAASTFLIGHELHMIALYPESRFGKPVAMIDTVFYGKAVTRLTFKDLFDAPFQVYYDKTDLLPLGMSQQNHLRAGPELINVLLEDWQSFGSVESFSKARFFQGEDVYTYQFTDIRFEKPKPELYTPSSPMLGVPKTEKGN